MSLSELEELRWRDAVIRQKRWASNERNIKRSEWFILVDTKYKPQSAEDFAAAKAFCDGLMKDFTRELKNGTIVALNRITHAWNSEYIDSIRVRYVVELGLGKLKKDGTRGKTGGTVHIHILLTLLHYTNMSLPYENLQLFFTQPLEYRFGKRPFIGHPRLVKGNRTEEYMEKGFERAEWNEVNVSI